MLLAHENAHKVAVHWLDLLIGRIVACVDWYWPTVWLLMRDLSAVHEYQADSSVVSGGNDAVAYQMLLLRKGSPGMFSNIANPFSYYSLKNRITMMQKNQSSTRSRMRCLVMLPAAAVAILFSTAPALASAVKSYMPAPADSYAPAAGSTAINLEAVAAQIAEFEAEQAEALKSAPSFPGGEEAMYSYLAKHIRYPEEAAKNDIQGRVIVQFRVAKDGSLSEFKVVEGVDPLLDAEAIRVVKSMPKFVPATENGDAVAEWFTLPINFRLSADDSEYMYILDGKSVSADDIRNLDKNDIDGTTVLAGDKAKELFGEKAAKGAIVVQTKAYATEQAKLKETAAHFEGGDEAMFVFLNRNLRYPEEAAEKNIQGRVIVQFKIQKDGSITDAKVARGVDPQLDAEAIRVVESMPKFVPATKDGEPVAVWYTMPINFRLSGNDAAGAKK